MSDIENTGDGYTVVGIQGNPVDSAEPSDKDVLTWDAVENNWTPRPLSGLNKLYFTSSGNWTCPNNVRNILLIACGGGSGGFAGRALSQSGSSGNNAIQVTSSLTVTPGATYTITIGAGGLGGIGDKVTQPNNYVKSTLIEYTLPTDGSSTSFSHSGTILFSVKGASASESSPDSFINTYSNGNNGSTDVSKLVSGQGGIGGLAGPQGNGGNGGNGDKSTGGLSAIASNGFDAGANTGAGGGGGGGCGYDSIPYTNTGGNGGDGGSGYMYIIY